MANKKLRGIVWPNLPNDTYLLDSGEVDYSAEASYRDGTVGKALQSKANIDGSYADLTAGNAEQLVSSVRTNDKVPYLFRTSGGSADIGDREYINGIVGGTVAWNQLVKIRTADSSKTENGVTITDNRDGTFSVVTASGGATANTSLNIDPIDVIAGHKYLWTATPANGSTATYYSYIAGLPFNAKEDVGSGVVYNATATGTGYPVGIYVKSGAVFTTAVKFIPMCFDLTQMFGTTIADYIYSLEQSTAGAGVAWFKKLFPKPYYEYNAGTLKSVEGLTSHDTVGFNLWDEEWINGYWDYQNNGAFVANSNFFACKNKIPCLPNITYFWQVPSVVREMLFYDADENYISRQSYGAIAPTTVTTPSDAHFMTFYCASAYGTTYNHDICINLSWDGSRNGEYEPYVKHSYPLDSDLTLRGIPKLDANNNLYYDGDTYESDGTVTRKRGVVTLDGSSDELWNTKTWLTNVFSYNDSSVNNVSSQQMVTVMSNYLESRSQDQIASSTSTYGVAQFSWGAQLAIRIENITSLDGLKAYLAEHPLQVVYELATPTTETADPYQTPQIVDDFGTEEYVTDSIVPVGHDTDYPVNLVAKLEMSPNSPSGGDGDYIVRQTNGENSYVPLVIEDALPTIPSTAGSYKLTVTVTEGSDPVLSWEAE